MRPWTQVPPQPGRRFVVTGANGGLGLETARILGSRGAEVVLACRSVSKGEAAARTVPGHDKGRVTVRRLDVSDLGSVRAFVAGLTDEGRPVDVLVNNAGVLGIPYGLSEEGVEPALRDQLPRPLRAHPRPGAAAHRPGRHRQAPGSTARATWTSTTSAGCAAPTAPSPPTATPRLAGLLFMREAWTAGCAPPAHRCARSRRTPGRRRPGSPAAPATPCSPPSGTTGSGWSACRPGVARSARCTPRRPTSPAAPTSARTDARSLWGWPAPARMSRKVGDEQPGRRTVGALGGA
ncbi:SDR family NAD(P)-dependent oxidoreductase [Nocardioides sp. W3-2-3]|nr:SDR family NAD(P)-dependent oxidoreductase [Nocardioides convexus]